jgi:aspartate/methionine/tyrosine aminotransferase
MPNLTSSAAQVPRSRIRKLAEVAMRMDGVLKSYFGESNVPTPNYIKGAPAAALAEGYTFYTENAGLPDSFAFCWTLLQETKVGIAPGVAFDAEGEGSARICDPAERAILEPAMERLARFLSTAWT